MSRISIHVLNGGWTDLLFGVAIGWVTAGTFVCLVASILKPKDTNAG